MKIITIEVDKLEVANAIRELRDPFTCSQVIEALGLEKNKENQKQVTIILHQFKKRRWITNSANNLYFRSLEDFRF